MDRQQHGRELCHARRPGNFAIRNVGRVGRLLFAPVSRPTSYHQPQAVVSTPYLRSMQVYAPRQPLGYARPSDYMKLNIQTILSYIVSLLVPLILIGTAVRILLSPIYYTVEYNMPYFPPDEYGMTQAERLHWAPYAVDYLVNDADISYLGDLKFEDGSELYNERELSHMEDVKNVVQGA